MNSSLPPIEVPAGRVGLAQSPLTSTLADVLAHSYADFHVKGFDYLCLKRSADVTIKAYFFDGDVASAPEVVVPHDHRYRFSTHVLSGSSLNRQYEVASPGAPDASAYEAFNYRTILNGGDGFTWRETAWLRPAGDVSFAPGQGYMLDRDDIHTIQVTAPDTVLLLVQGADAIPLHVPTTAYRPRGVREAPSLSGLYREMDPDRALARIAQLNAVWPNRFEVSK